MSKQPKFAGKTIKIDGLEFKVTESFLDIESMEDVLVLKRKADWLPEYEVQPSAIYDLGYNSPKDIKYSDELLIEKMLEIEKNIGKMIDIAIVDSSGLIKLEKVVFYGASLTEPDLVSLEFPDGRRQMPLDFLLTSSLLADEFNQAIEDYEYIETLDEPYKKILNDLEPTEDSLEKVMEIFSRFFARRLNGN